MILIFCTFGNKKAAHELGKQLLNKKLIACYNMTPVESAYWWKGKILDENEILMIMKTNKKFEEVQKFITEHHSYNTPEIIGVKTQSVGKKYLKWIRTITG